MGEGPQDPVADEELVARVRHGDTASADELARRHRTAIARFCAAYLEDHAAGEDVAQEVFAKLTDADALPTGSVKPWLYKVARNRCLDILRRHQRSPTHNRPIRTGFDAPRRTAGPRTRVAREERQALIRDLIAQMPDEYRSVLMLKYFEGLERTEIAEALGLTDAAVKGRLVRATEYLEEELRKHTGTLG